MRVPPAIVRVGLRSMRPVFTASRLPMAAKRRIANSIAAVSPVPAGVLAKAGSLAGVPLQELTPPNAVPDTALLFLHGGGYASGNARGYRGFAGALAAATSMRVVVVDYRLAPEHPFPAAFDDAFEVYRALLEQVQTIVVAGDSAGGGLSLAIAQRIRDTSLRMPVALGLICPWLDLARDHAKARVAAKDPLIIPSLIAEWCSFYVGTGDARTPGVSPIHGDLTALPPIVMHSAGDDPLAVDADEFERKMALGPAGCTLVHRRFPNRWHDFHLQVGFLADADAAVELFGTQLVDLVAAHRRDGGMEHEP